MIIISGTVVSLVCESVESMHRVGAPCLTYFPEIDVSPINICVLQLYAELVTDIEAFKATHEFPFNGRLQKTDPCPFDRCASDDRIELFSNSRLQQNGSGGFCDLPFDLFRRILILCAVFCERRQFIGRIGHRTASHRSIQ